MGDECVKCETWRTVMEQRVQALEEADKKHIEFRKEYYQDREARIRRDEQLDSRIASMDEKLDKLLEWQEAQQNKPARLIDGIVEKAVWAILAAVAGFLAAQIGM